MYFNFSETESCQNLSLLLANGVNLDILQIFSGETNEQIRIKVKGNKIKIIKKDTKEIICTTESERGFSMEEIDYINDFDVSGNDSCDASSDDSRGRKVRNFSILSKSGVEIRRESILDKK